MTNPHRQITGIDRPLSVSVDPMDGAAWVTSFHGNFVAKISSDGTHELFRRTGVNGPHSVFVNPVDGTAWVVNYYGGDVAIFSRDGRELHRLTGLYYPTGVVAYSPPGTHVTSTENGNAAFTYPRVGQFTATLTVQDNDGNLDTNEVIIRAGTFPVSLPEVYPTRGPAPLTVIVGANGRCPGGTIEGFYWDFNGDGTDDWSTPISASNTHTFQTPGTYSVRQRIVDNRGLSDTATVQVIVDPPGDGTPSAIAIATPDQGISPLLVQFTGGGRDSDGFIRKFEWDFNDDGTWDFTSTTTAATQHQYDAEGVYRARLRVTDNDNHTGTATVLAQVKAEGAPTVTATADPASGQAALNVTFGVSDPGLVPIVSYEWDFDGNGTTDYRSETSGAASHSYTEAGDYQAVLRVTDNQGGTDIDVVRVSVTAGLAASLSRDVFNPTIGETLSINSALTMTAAVTVKVLDRNGGPVRTLVSGASRHAGFYADPWDGKNDAGQIVPSGVYLYIIEYVINGKRYVYDVTNNVSTDRFTPGTQYPSSFNPFSAETNFFRYSMDKKSEITVYIAPFAGGAGNRIKTLLLRKPQKAGSYVLVWDGTDDLGNVVPAGNYVIAPQGWELPANAIIVQTEPVVSDLAVTPGYFNPDVAPYDDEERARFSYSLSKAADVKLSVYDENNYIVRTVTENDVPAGTGMALYWDGKNSNGAYVPPGIYRTKVVATDAEGSRSEEANALMVIFY